MKCTCPLVWDGSAREPRVDIKRIDKDCMVHGGPSLQEMDGLYDYDELENIGHPGHPSNYGDK